MASYVQVVVILAFNISPICLYDNEVLLIPYNPVYFFKYSQTVAISKKWCRSAVPRPEQVDMILKAVVPVHYNTTCCKLA